MKKHHGFTLIELVIVVVLIGILAGSALLNYFWAVERGRSAEAKEILFKAFAGYERLMMEEELVGGGNPLNWTRCGMSDPNTAATRYFNYAFLPNNNTPNRVRAERIGDASRWLMVNFTTGILTKSTPY